MGTQKSSLARDIKFRDLSISGVSGFRYSSNKNLRSSYCELGSILGSTENYTERIGKKCKWKLGSSNI